MSHLKRFAGRRRPFVNARRGRTRLRVEYLEERVVLDATVIEDFTQGLAPYTTVLRFSPNADVIPGAGHDGISNALLKSDGYEWLVRNDSAVQVQQGETISVWVDLAGNADGRAYFSFGARPNAVNDYLRTGGGLSLVLAPNSNQLIVENNIGFNHNTLAAVPMNYAADQWYRAEVVWGTDGSITGNLYDSDGVTLLASVSTSSLASTSGGIGFRGFGSDKYFDTVTVDTGSSGIHQGPAIDPGHRPAHLDTQSGQHTRSDLLDPFEYQSVPGTGRDIWLAEFDQLQQFGMLNGVVGLAATNRSENHGSASSYWGQMGWGPVVQGLGSNAVPIETPLLQQYVFRQRPGEDTTIIGRSDMKHFFLSVGVDPQQLRPGEQDTYGAGLNADQDFYSPQQDVDPVTGMISNQALDYFGEGLASPRNADGLNQFHRHSFSPIDHLLQVNVADLDPTQNPPGTVWYLAGNIFTPGDEDVSHTSRWVKIQPSFNGSTFTFTYPDGSGGHYDVRTIPGLAGLPPQVVGQTPSGSVYGPVAVVEVTFSNPINVTSFTPDKITSFTGPNGDITINAVTPVAGTNNTTFDITFDSQSDVGDYTMIIGPDIQDMSGNSMAAAYTARFTIIPNDDGNLLVNGGFETGDFTGWTLSGNTGSTFVDNSHPHRGTYAANLGPVGSEGFMTQTFATTPGITYVLSYWLTNEGGTPNQFEAYIDGTVVPGSQIMNGSATPYTQWTFTFMATGTTTQLKLGYQQDPAYFHLDDVSVMPAPVNLEGGVGTSLASALATAALVHNSTAASVGTSKWGALGVQGQQPSANVAQQPTPAAGLGAARFSLQPDPGSATVAAVVQPDGLAYPAASANGLFAQPVLDDLFQTEGNLWPA
jgi:hypothetical protein